MSKAMRLTILLLLTAFAGLVLKDTVIWNKFTAPEKQELALKTREEIRDYSLDSAKKALKTLKDSLAADPAAPLPQEFSFLINGAKVFYGYAAKPEPSQWNLALVLGAFPLDKDKELTRQLEAHYREEVLALKTMQGNILNLGLDLRGGMSVTIQADIQGLEEKLGKTLDSAEREDALSRTLEILTSRIDSFGMKEPQIKREPGGDQIFVDIPGEPDKNVVDSFLRGKGSLSFNIVDDEATAALVQYLRAKPDTSYDSKTRLPLVPAELIPEGRVLRMAYEKDAYGLDRRIGPQVLFTDDKHSLDGSLIESARPDRDAVSNLPIVSFKLNPQGTEIFAKMTQENVNKRMSVVMDERVRATANIVAPIPLGNVKIDGFSAKEAQDLAKVLRTGALPVQMIVQSVESIGASLGQNALDSALQAAFWAMVLVVGFMIVYYKGAGINAIVALAFNVFLLISLLAAFKTTLTMTSIAGLILTIGMAVDANVIIFERIKEEYLAGKSPLSSVQAGFGKAFWTILDSNITTLIASVLLSFMGKGSIQGFGITLSLGVVTSMFTALFLTRFLFDVQLDLFKSNKLSITWRSVSK